MKRTYQVSVNGTAYSVDLVGRTHDTIVFTVNGATHSATISSRIQLAEASASRPSISQAISSAAQAVQSAPGSVVAPMPGIISRIFCEENATVDAGAPLLIIEAMKMENNINAGASGRIKKVHVKAGDEVRKGQLLVTIEGE